MGYGGDPSNSTSDAVRLLIGDTTAPEIYTDEEIAWYLTEHADDPTNAAKAILAARMAAVAASAGSVTIGRTSESDHRHEAFRKALDALSEVSGTSPPGAVGPAHVYDTSDDAGIFTVGMHDYPGWSA